MKPTEQLVHDHEVILHMLNGAERLAHTIETTRTVDLRKVDAIIDFSRNFTDGCHHAKEERHLFKRLAERGLPPNQGPVAVMLREHSVGRDLIKGIESAAAEFRSGNQWALDNLSHMLLQYVELLRAHIAKENNVLFPMSDRVLLPEDQCSVEDAFRRIEEIEFGPKVHERYYQMAHELGGEI